jgi:hypothetical protein
MWKIAEPERKKGKKKEPTGYFIVLKSPECVVLTVFRADGYKLWRSQKDYRRRKENEDKRLLEGATSADRSGVRADFISPLHPRPGCMRRDRRRPNNRFGESKG